MFEADGDGQGVNLNFKGWIVIIAIDIKNVVLMWCPEDEMTLGVSRCTTALSADAGPSHSLQSGENNSNKKSCLSLIHI